MKNADFWLLLKKSRDLTTSDWLDKRYGNLDTYQNQDIVGLYNVKKYYGWKNINQMKKKK